jgi:hypothetical protein
MYFYGQCLSARASNDAICALVICFSNFFGGTRPCGGEPKSEKQCP